MITNCVIIGRNTEVSLPEDSDGYIIIGNDIKSIDRNQENMVFIGEKLIMTKEVWEAITKTLGYNG